MRNPNISLMSTSEYLCVESESWRTMYIVCIFVELNLQILVDCRTSGPSDWWTSGWSPFDNAKCVRFVLAPVPIPQITTPSQNELRAWVRHILCQARNFIHLIVFITISTRNLMRQRVSLQLFTVLTRRQELLPPGKFTYEYVLAGISKEVLVINIHHCTYENKGLFLDNIHHCI
jgi:hypothetical protein